MYTVAVRLDAASAAVRPGMAAEVAIDFAVAGDPGRVVVPAAAVSEDMQGRFVFLVEPSGNGLAVVRRRSVTVGGDDFRWGSRSSKGSRRRAAFCPPA